jgi:hypothetical protein
MTRDWRGEEKEENNFELLKKFIGDIGIISSRERKER